MVRQELQVVVVVQEVLVQVVVVVLQGLQVLQEQVVRQEVVEVLAQVGLLVLREQVVHQVHQVVQEQ